MSLRNLLLRTALQKKSFINFAAVAIENNKQDSHGKYKENRSQYKKVLALSLFSSVLVGSAIEEQIDNRKGNKSKPKSDEDVIEIQAGERKPGLPTFKAEEVSKHDNKKSFWVTYKHGVYDVTNFLSSHPGGEQIMNAAGLSIEPFWNVYGMHKTQEVYKLLESYRIGNLDSDDVVDHSDDELWVKEPYRDKRLIVKTAKPFNAEIPPKYQIEHFDTPNELFYVRQHMPVPECDAATHTLKVVIKSRDSTSTDTSTDSSTSTSTVRQFTLVDLERFRRVTLRAALMCAGNRRSEMNKVKPVKGISWAGGAISNAVWSGVPLRDLLLDCGVDPEDTQGKHVIFAGCDIDATGVNFSTSIPLDMAMNPSSSILLATHMNGSVLPLDHGYPLRVVVPGAPAVRSVKWLESITISEDESPSHWHQKDYRSFNPSKTWETADFASAPPVYSLPVTSAICDPADGDLVEVNDGKIEVRGYAYSGGGAMILRVDVSADGGRSWVQARPAALDGAPPLRHYSWMLWQADVPVPVPVPGQPDHRQVELWAKATDSNFNTQPEKFDDIWNIRGILSNAYHKIKVQLKH